MDAVQVRDMMTADVATLEREQSLPLAEQLMGLRRVRHLPVVDGEGRVVGLVTHRDLLRARVSGLVGLSEDERAEIQLTVPVERIMTHGVWTVHPGTPALEAAQLLTDHRFGCLPVVDDRHRLIGIVTEADFLAMAVAVLHKNPERRVDSLMSRRLVTLFEEQSLSLAHELMALRQLRHLPVVDDHDHLVGLVTHRDLLAAQSSALSRAPAFSPEARVAEIVQRNVWTVSPATSAFEAARTLAENRFGCLPVLDQGSLVGLITEADFLRFLVQVLARDRRRLARRDVPVNYYMSEHLRTVSIYDSAERARALMLLHAVSGLGVLDDGELVGVVSATDLLDDESGDGSVGSLMTPGVVSARPQDPISAAGRRMVDRHIHRLFIVEGTHPIGVLSATDLLAALRDLRIDAPLADYATSPLFTVDAAEPVHRARALLGRAALTGVVVTRAGVPVGSFTQLEALAARDLPPETPVAAVMRCDAVTVPASMPLYRAAGRAAELHARAVIASAGDGVGEAILTGMDAARAIA